MPEHLLHHWTGRTYQADGLELAMERAPHVQVQTAKYEAITPWAVSTATSAVASLAQAELDSPEGVPSARRATASSWRGCCHGRHE